MSSSGLIYAVIVGAWAAYLVPMWLRRQDELNEARPTERFSTAIRLLAGRSAMERRASKALGEETSAGDGPVPGEPGDPAGDLAGVPAEAFAVGEPPERQADRAPIGDPAPEAAPSAPVTTTTPARETAHGSTEGRARLLARRRRMVTTLFLAFAAGAVAAAVLGVAFLWIPALPALLLTLYIGHLRRLERQRYEVKLDRTRAARAAERLRERERTRAAAAPAVPAPGPAPAEAAPTPRQAPSPARGAAAPASARPHLRLATTDSALVEATDHEEWVDGMRDRAPAGPDSWEPVPVPLPTYVTAPVAPRTTPGLDARATAWDSGRAANTPLFDQYADPDRARADARAEARAEAAAEADYPSRPRAANE
ncbi:divisome protein SepX/GlpR [Kitasatospora sp. NPDC001664]